jgi:hypothetical protein
MANTPLLESLSHTDRMEYYLQRMTELLAALTGGAPGGSGTTDALLTQIRDTLQTVQANTDQLETPTQNIEVRANQLQLQTDELEGLTTAIRDLLTTIRDNTDQLEVPIAAMNINIGEIEAFVQTMEGALNNLLTLLRGTGSAGTTFIDQSPLLLNLETKLDTLITAANALQTNLANPPTTANQQGTVPQQLFAAWEKLDEISGKLTPTARDPVGPPVTYVATPIGQTLNTLTVPANVTNAVMEVLADAAVVDDRGVFITDSDPPSTPTAADFTADVGERMVFDSRQSILNFRAHSQLPTARNLRFQFYTGNPSTTAGGGGTTGSTAVVRATAPQTFYGQGPFTLPVGTTSYVIINYGINPTADAQGNLTNSGYLPWQLGTGTRQAWEREESWSKDDGTAALATPLTITPNPGAPANPQTFRVLYWVEV